MRERKRFCQIYFLPVPDSPIPKSPEIMDWLRLSLGFFPYIKKCRFSMRVRRGTLAKVDFFSLKIQIRMFHEHGEMLQEETVVFFNKNKEILSVRS